MSLMSLATETEKPVEVEIVPNERGGYGFHVLGTANQFGNYPTAADARRVAEEYNYFVTDIIEE